MQDERGLAVVQQLGDLIGVEAVELRAVGTGVVEEDVEHGGAFGDGADGHTLTAEEARVLAIGPRAVRQHDLRHTRGVRLALGDGARGQVRLLHLAGDHKPGRTSHGDDGARSDQDAARDLRTALPTLLLLSECLSLHAGGLASLCLGRTGGVRGHGELLRSSAGPLNTKRFNSPLMAGHYVFCLAISR